MNWGFLRLDNLLKKDNNNKISSFILKGKWMIIMTFLHRKEDELIVTVNNCPEATGRASSRLDKYRQTAS